MTETISVTDATVTVDTLVGKLDSADRLVIERDGKPVAVVVTVDEYARLDAMRAEADWNELDALAQRNAQMDSDEAEVEISAEDPGPSTRARSTTPRRCLALS